jgi:hypothetical protein
MRRALVIPLLLLLAGCGVPRVTPQMAAAAQARWPDLDQPRLEAARDLYLRRCSACHGLYVPDDYSEREWPERVRKMQKKAKIDDAQRDEIVRFLIAARTPGR